MLKSYCKFILHNYGVLLLYINVMPFLHNDAILFHREYTMMSLYYAMLYNLHIVMNIVVQCLKHLALIHSVGTFVALGTNPGHGET